MIQNLSYAKLFLILGLLIIPASLPYLLWFLFLWFWLFAGFKLIDWILTRVFGII